MIGTISDTARLLRGFATDFLTSHDGAEVERIMDPAYRLSIGGHVFDGRDNSYFPATAAQLEQFPGLCVTVHDVVLGPAWAAMRFTEHGVSIRDPGRASTWGGVTLFNIVGGRLRYGWAEEDYFARKRQLKSGSCDAILPPHPAPWDQPCLPPDPATEAAARSWLGEPDRILDPAKVEEICAEGPKFGELLRPATVEVTALFTAGPRAAFHCECSGTYAGGFADIDASLGGEQIVLRMAGILDVQDGEVCRVQLSADRLGLHRELLGRARANGEAA